MKSKAVFVIATVSLLTVACAARPTGHKIYDKVVLVSKTDNILLSPSNISPEFIKIFSARIHDFSETELTSQGDLELVTSCGPRTLKVMQDVASLGVGSQSEASTSGFFVPKATAKASSEITVTITTTITDCETNKILKKFTYSNNGQDPAAVLQTISNWNIYEVYQRQRALVRPFSQ